MEGRKKVIASHFRPHTLHLAFFYQIKERHGEEIESITRHLDKFDETTHQLELPYTFTLASLIGSINTERFYMYQGTNVILAWVEVSINFHRLLFTIYPKDL